MSTKESKPRSRATHVEAILGREFHGRLTSVKVLLVGAGGIGCELRASHSRACLGRLMRADAVAIAVSVKNIVLTGFGDITLLDLDTIDLSNLNRQFLFRKKDVKQSKALVRLLLSVSSLRRNSY